MKIKFYPTLDGRVQFINRQRDFGVVTTRKGTVLVLPRMIEAFGGDFLPGYDVTLAGVHTVPSTGRLMATYITRAVQPDDSIAGQQYVQGKFFNVRNGYGFGVTRIGMDAYVDTVAYEALNLPSARDFVGMPLHTVLYRYQSKLYAHKLERA